MLVDAESAMNDRYPPASPTSPPTSTRYLPASEHGDDTGGRPLLENVDDLDRALSAHSSITDNNNEITRFMALLVGCAAISGLLFGYDTGVISGTLVVIGSDLGRPLGDLEKELITSATTLGALIGGLASGAISDSIGRKGFIGIAGAVFVLGASWQAASHSIASMTAGRFVVGLAVGSASCVVPMYIGELSPAALRGRLVTINCVAITLGQVLAYAIGASLEHAPSGWRWMVGLGALPGILQLSTLHLLPESPRVLILRGQIESAETVLQRMYPSANPLQVSKKVDEMVDSVRVDMALGGASLKQKLHKLIYIGSNRRALVVGAGLQATQQLCGFNTLMYYSASIFAALGYKNATAVGLLIALVNFGFTLVALQIVDPFGRRKTMLYTIPIMAIALLLASLFFHRLTIPTGGILLPNPPAPYLSTLASLVLMAMLFFVAGYALGAGNIPWQQGELFRLEVRGVGTSICTAVNWSSNLVVGATFLSLMRLASPAGAFGLYSLFCIGSWVFCWLCYPETSGLSLEDVFKLFEHGYGVR